LNDYRSALKLKNSKDTAVLGQAYALFTRSVKSFPDSFVAGKCHQYRAELLEKLDRKEEAAFEATRAREFYVNLP